MEKKIRVNLNDSDKLKRFIQVVRGFESDIDVVTNTGSCDAKSIVGVFSLDLSKDTYAIIIPDNDEEENLFIEAMKEFE